MSYNIVKSDGTPLVTVNDGQTNNTATSLTLVGKNFAGYGTFLNENFVKLLEHFASANEPQYPKAGQLWYQTSTKLLQVYNGSAWKSISGAQALADEPTYKVAGDLWFDSVNQQLKVWSGAGWIVIGPSFTSTTGTSGAVADTVIDSSQFSHVVVKFFVQNQLIGILSKDAAFQPATNIPGFATIKPGFNLAKGRTPELVFYENANNSAYLGGLSASQFLTRDNAQLTQKLVIRNTDGLEIQETDGTVTDFQLYVSNNNVNLVSLVRGNGMVFRIKPDNAGGSFASVLTVDKVTGLITVLNDPTDPAGVATKNYVDSRDNTTRSFITANVASLNANAGVLTGNTNQVYANVRTLQNDLGYNTTLGGASYTKLTTGDTFASNIVTLWANVAAIHSNVLSATGVGGTATASMYSNVVALQGQLSSTADASLRRDGTNSITGVLIPDQANTTNLGSAGRRFSTFFTESANVATITNLASINTTGPRGNVDAFTLYANPLRLTGNITFLGGSGTTIGINDDLNIEGALTTKGNIRTKTDNTWDIGQPAVKFKTIYVDKVVATTLEGAVSGGSGSSSFGATVFSGNINPSADNTYNVGNGGARWKEVVATALTTSYVKLESTGIKLGTGASDITLDIGGTGAKFRDIYGRYFYGGSTELTSAGIFITSGATNQDIGTSSAKYRAVYATTFYGVATTAQYADLAERFESDKAYPVGTVVTLGGEKEVTSSTVDGDSDVFGVISTDPAYLMNSEAGNNDTHPPVALAGRVPVRVVGQVRKNARLISAGNGCARAAGADEITPFNVIGRALEAKSTDGEGVIEAIVKVNL